MQHDPKWSFYNPVRVIFGPASITGLSTLTPFEKVLLITSPGFTKRGLTEKFRLLLKSQQVAIVDDVVPNPDIETIDVYRTELYGKGFQCVIGVGGGSVLDTAKALSYLLSLEDERFSLKGHFVDKVPLPESAPLPMIAIPTTAGTGSEVTPFSTIWDYQRQEKYSLTTTKLFPAVALLDPELTLTLSLETTIISGLDALSHAFESVWNCHANPITLCYAARAIDIIITTLPALLRQPRALNYRTNMMTAALFGGFCISSTRTALAHSMSYPITISLDVPHGLACGFALPELLKFNAQNDDGRLSMVARMIGYDSIVEVEKRINEMYELLDIKKLMMRYKMTKTNVLNLIPQMCSSERFGNNLCAVSIESLEKILEEVYDRVS